LIEEDWHCHFREIFTYVILQHGPETYLHFWIFEERKFVSHGNCPRMQAITWSLLD